MYSQCTLNTVSQTHGIQVHAQHVQLVPHLPLQLSRDGSITPAPAHHKCSIKLLYGVVAAPHHYGPVPRNPDELPVLHLEQI